MSVSAGSGGLDLDTIVSGGAAFVQRLAEFQIAAAAYKKSLDDLNLGQSAQRAYDEAQALLAQAKAKIQAAEGEAERTVADARRRADKFDRDVAEAKASLRDRIEKVRVEYGD